MTGFTNNRKLLFPRIDHWRYACIDPMKQHFLPNELKFEQSLILIKGTMYDVSQWEICKVG